MIGTPLTITDIGSRAIPGNELYIAVKLCEPEPLMIGAFIIVHRSEPAKLIATGQP